MFGVNIAPMPDASEEAQDQPTIETAEVIEPTQRAGDRHYAPDAAHRGYKLNRWRYYRIVTFFLGLTIRSLFWEMTVKWLLGEKFVAKRRAKRYRGEARKFRLLAVDMGGVMIKLGQFISSRMDVLPPEITEELAGLQDQVPIVPFEYIKQTVEREIGPIGAKFAWFNPEPVAAASFGQVHRAQMPNGDRVVVKVQRPGLTNLVHTDLSALGYVAKFSMRFGFISRRANMPMLIDEFSRVLWEELDYIAEADHALTFASIFKDDGGIYVPSVYLDYTTALVLTLEDVTTIKINDYAAIERAGINRNEVARRLLDCYLHQIFEIRFFHADPHPGNLFVYPLPVEDESRIVPGKRPFYLIFVDFGMVGRLTSTLQEGLRETLIAVVTQNAEALVASYQKLGVLLPGTNVKRVEEATRAVFDKVWGLNMSEMANLPMDEMTEMAKEFSDLLLSMPFQMPQDFIYLSRAVGIVSGMCTGLDPQFDPWHEIQPFAQKILSESSDRTQSALGGTVSTARTTINIATQMFTDLVKRTYKLPGLADNVLSRADRGELEVRMAPDDGLKQQINKIERATSQIAYGMVFATVALASTLLYINQEHGLGVVGFGLAGLIGVVMVLRGRG